MTYNPEKHHRRSIRLKGYDYTQAGFYFVTLCISQRECLLGEIINGQMQLSPAGKIVEKEWLRTALVRPNVELDTFVIMPNHIHGIIVLTNIQRAIQQCLSTHSQNITKQVAPTEKIITKPRPAGPISSSLGAIIGQFKSLCAKRINRIRQMPGVPVWQRDFYDHIIHHEVALHTIRQYIIENPQRWQDDPINPRYPIPDQDPLMDLPF